MQLVILCGGLGTRLGKLAQDKPKILMDIDGTSFLRILIKEYRNAGFDNFVLLAGHLANKLKKDKIAGVKIITEKERLGTGGAVINALNELEPHFYVCNGDTFIECEDIERYVQSSQRINSSLMLGKNHAGLFSFNKKDMRKFEVKNLNLEKDIIRHLLSFNYIIRKGKYYDIGTPTRLNRFRKYYGEQK